MTTVRPVQAREKECYVPNAVAAPTTHILEWLAISLTQGLGPTKARKLVEHFGSAEAVFHASLTELEGTGIQAVSAQSIATGKSEELAREEIAHAAEAGVTVLTQEDHCYPSRLKEIYDPPLVLYVRGNPEVLTQPGIAMVGTRHPTPYGSGRGERLAWGLAGAGLGIFAGRGASTLPVIAGRSQTKAKRLRHFGTGVDM